MWQEQLRSAEEAEKSAAELGLIEEEETSLTNLRSVEFRSSTSLTRGPHRDPDIDGQCFGDGNFTEEMRSEMEAAAEEGLASGDGMEVFTRSPGGNKNDSQQRINDKKSADQDRRLSLPRPLDRFRKLFISMPSNLDHTNY